MAMPAEANAPAILGDDATARQQALDITTSVLVRAPAGSGKTGLLTQRLLRLLAEVEEPEAVLALTFTRKAAGEMRARVLTALEQADGPAPPEAHARLSWELARAARAQDERRHWQLARSPARLQILTLDSLALRLAGRMPWLTRLGPAPRPTPEAEPLHRAAARATLARMDGPGAPGAAARALLRHLHADLDAAETLLAKLLARRDAWLPLLFQGTTRTQFDAILGQVLQAELDATRQQLHDAGVTVTIAGPDLANWRELADQVLTKSGSPRKKGPYPQLAGAAGEALHRTRQLPEPAYTDAEWDLIAILMRLLPLAAAELRLVFAEHGACDFTEVSLAAAHALGTPEAASALAYALDARLRHIFVDEFQDTSRAQYALLRGLVADWSAGDGRTLFLVGDPMQSIYRFRDAEVSLFQQAEAEQRLGAVPLQCVQLRRNFRTGRALVDWVGSHFEVTSLGQESASSACVHAVAGGNPRNEAMTVVRLVQQEVAAGARSIAILVQTRTHVAAIHRELRQAGIVYWGSQLLPLGDSPVVLDLMALTRAVQDPADRVAWLAVLRAPWCGLTLASLHMLCAGDRDTPILELWRQRRGALPADEAARAAPVLAVLEAAARQRGRVRPRTLMTWCWHALQADACAPDRAADADAFLACLDRATGLDAAALEAAISGLFAADERPPERGAAVDDGEPAPSRIEVMTLHHAKGLEFDAVILPGLARWPNRADAPLLNWAEFVVNGSAHWLLAPKPARGAGAGKAERSVYGLIQAREARQNADEQRRLLYVGMTRARTRLHLVAAMPLSKKDGRLTAPDSRSPLARIWETLQPEFERQYQQHRSAAGLAAHEQRSQALATTAAKEAPRLRRVRTPAAAAPPLPETAASRPPAVLAPDHWEQATGTAVHALLRRLAEDAAFAWEGAPLEMELRAAGVLPADLPAALQRAQRALRRVADDPRARWILDRHPQARCEWEISAVTADGVRRSIMDRSFVTADGTRWIIDYKITEPGPDAEAAAWLEAERERYRPQLEAYARVLAALEIVPPPARCGLYFPLTGDWCEWAV